jgi:hypothetical protein
MKQSMYKNGNNLMIHRIVCLLPSIQSNLKMAVGYALPLASKCDIPVADLKLRPPRSYELINISKWK